MNREKIIDKTTVPALKYMYTKGVTLDNRSYCLAAKHNCLNNKSNYKPKKTTKKATNKIYFIISKWPNDGVKIYPPPNIASTFHPPTKLNNCLGQTSFEQLGHQTGPTYAGPALCQRRLNTKQKLQNIA